MKNFTRFGGAACLIALLICQPRALEAGGQGFDKNVLEDDSSKEVVDSKSSDLDLGRFRSSRFQVSVSLRGGYDDNVNLSTFDEQESFFTNAAIGLAYNFGNSRTRLSLTGGAGVTYYFDRDSGDDGILGDSDDEFEDYDVNAYLGFSITHKATPRLTLAAVLYASYQSQPDFSTFNSNTFTANRRSQDFFFTSNRFSAGYAWAPRFSTVSSYTLTYIDYDDPILSNFQDRFEHTLGNEFRFLIAPVTTLVAEYRFGIVDYTDDDFVASRNSTSHFLLGGVDHSFSPRFNVSARGGVEFRNFDDDDGDDIFGDDDNRVHPYAEGTINYAIAQNTSISLFQRYSLEQPDVPDAFTRSTYRTALTIRHAFTARISAGLNFAYQHDDYDGNDIIDGFDEDSFDLGIWGRYALNRNFAFDIGYQRTEVISDEALFREFSRNRYYAGFTFTF